MAYKYNRLEMAENKKTSLIFADLTPESVANLCFKSVRTVEKWRKSGCIPPESRRLLKLYLKRAISDESEWDGFYMEGNRLRLPTGQLVQPQQILLAMALLEFGAEPERLMLARLNRTARAIARIKLRANNHQTKLR